MMKEVEKPKKVEKREYIIKVLVHKVEEDEDE